MRSTLCLSLSGSKSTSPTSAALGNSRGPGTSFLVVPLPSQKFLLRECALATPLAIFNVASRAAIPRLALWEIAGHLLTQELTRIGPEISPSGYLLSALGIA